MRKSLKIKRLQHAADLPLPKRMSSAASGFDIGAACEGRLTLKPGERALIPTGFCYEIPRGYEVQIRPRSGLAHKHGLTVLNAPGTVDSDYRGEIKVLLINLGQEPYTIHRGDRIAQAVVAAVAADCEILEADQLTDTKRGRGGFGHTGSA